MFAHERFEAYQISLRFLQKAIYLTAQLESGNAAIKDQFKRAASSISLNIAEGSGRTSKLERRRFYSFARGSAMECAAICDIVGLLDEKLSDEVSQAKDLLNSIVGILTTVCSDK